ncbi:hypothetical protein [Salinarimonas rosea]|uniref:hypothetical protein n=1 Tax=Salinarimonas rosea TaxID=552063 RepID=UPI000409FC57|nr:hypothetical protein [Salinarimonas rosea]
MTTTIESTRIQRLEAALRRELELFEYDAREMTTLVLQTPPGGPGDPMRGLMAQVAENARLRAERIRAALEDGR